MNRNWKRALAALLAAGLGWSLQAQPPERERKGPPGEQPPRERRGEPGEPRGPRGEPGEPRGPRGEGPGRGHRVDPQVEAWIKTLAEKITDPHDEIRDSARAALAVIGRPALPTLQGLANGNDGAKATAAHKIMEAIEQAHPRGVRAMVQAQGPGMGQPGDQPRPDRPNANPPRPGEGRPNPNANPPGPGEGRPNPMAELLQSLELNDKQAKQIQDILESQQQKMREIAAQIREGKVDREEARPKMEQHREELLKAVKEVLTEEQFKKFEEGFRNMPRGPRPDGDRPRPDRD